MFIASCNTILKLLRLYRTLNKLTLTLWNIIVSLLSLIATGYKQKLTGPMLEAENADLRLELTELRNRMTTMEGCHSALKDTVNDDQNMMDALEVEMNKLHKPMKKSVRKFAMTFGTGSMAAFLKHSSLNIEGPL